MRPGSEDRALSLHLPRPARAARGARVRRARPRPRPLTRAAGLGLSCLLALLPVVLAAPHAYAAPHHNAARIAIDRFTPKAAGPKSVVRVSGRIVNTSGKALPSATIRLRYSTSTLPSRSQLKLYANGSAGSVNPQSVAVRHTLPHGIGAKASVRWSLKIPVSRLGLSGPIGVYPVAVDAVDSLGRTLAEQRTFLTYGTKSPAYKPTKVAWLWPIIDRPRRADDKTFMDDSLGRSLADGGRLSRLVAAGERNDQRVPLTWMVDPALLDDADHLSREHQVINGSNHTKTKPADTDATAWLGRLRSAIGTSPLAVTPYGDIDTAAVTRAGLDDDVKPAVHEGARITQRLLKRSVSTDIAWPSQGLADADSMDVMAFAGTRTVVLSQRALPASSQVSYTPDGVTQLPTSDGTVKALLADPTLSDVLGGTQRRSSLVVTEQRFLAETALITAELPNSPRTVVVAPPRRWDPTPGLARALLRDTRSVPWIKPVSATSAKSSSDLDRKLEYTNAEQQNELGHRYLDKVAEIRGRARRFGSIFPDGTSPDQLATFRMESSAWRGSPTRARRLRERVRWAVDRTSRKVDFVNRASVTMGGSEAKIPVTIANDLGYGDGSPQSREANTAKVRVRVTAPDSNGISIGSYDQVRRVGPNSKATLYVPVTARAVTVTNLRLELLAPDGQPINPPVAMKVRVTNIGETASWVTGAALAVLVIAAAVRFLRRRSRADGEPGDDSGTDSGTSAPADGPAATGTDDTAATGTDDTTGTHDAKGPVPGAVKVASGSDVHASAPSTHDDADATDDRSESTPEGTGMSSGNVREQHRHP